MISKVTAAALATVVIVALSGITATAQETRKEYFIFSHEFHIDGMGMECLDCHGDIQASRKSSDHVLPGHTECFVCHDGDMARDDCTVCHYNEDVINPSPKMTREINFNHELHLGQEKVECTTCHAGLEQTDYASSANMPKMETCVTCHNDARASQDCEVCHTQVALLRPASHTPSWIHRHDESMRSATEDCTICHQFDFCQECHDGATLAAPQKSNISNVPPVGKQNWNINNMVMQRNHSANFMFIHPVEARQNPERCKVCHDTESFCNTCHDSNAHKDLVKPDWHGGPDWGAVALGFGSGGGRHARMAKQDISLCASCHDANGEDPVCLLCHMDRNPGRNNDSRFHTFNLFRSMRGPWHDDPANTCFTCHINAQPQDPLGFCGYCHSIK